MSNVEYEIEDIHAHLSRTRSETQKNRKSKTVKWLTWSAIIVVWAGLLYGSYYLAQQYNRGLQTKMDTIQQTNQKNVDSLNKTITDLQTQLNQNKQDAQNLQNQFKNLENQLASVSRELAAAGNSLNSSDASKQALNQRISELSNELQSLQTSIQKLEAAARVY